MKSSIRPTSSAACSPGSTDISDVPGPIDAEIADFIATVNADWQRYPPLDTLSFPEARAVAEQVRRRWTEGGPVMAERRDVEIETNAGHVGVRIHRPAGVAETGAPALLYLHGGGFVFFSLDTHDRLMREYAARGQFVVIGIDYPLSPEARYPRALDQIVALIGWIGVQGATLGIDPARVAIGGDSAGANLALAACLRLRDAEGNVPLRAILSNYGAFSGACSDAAEAAHGGRGAVLTQAEMVTFFDHYLADPAQARDPYACPLAASDLSGLPPICLIIPERDVLTEQSLAIADRIRAADGTVTAMVYHGATHSFLEAMEISALARAALQDGARWVAQHLQLPPPSAR
ncbi:steryl acetyl hydrolase [Sphingomonas glacialis]|uniref:Steryl acetyl hydrolase n=1 Tax=Sphingomonas glacialis TaxID=658225 RepID=A0A502FCS5_9SPHN|nr:steryl acetyl hydrolase [Sphingomonas glacialis]